METYVAYAPDMATDNDFKTRYIFSEQIKK